MRTGLRRLAVSARAAAIAAAAVSVVALASCGTARMVQKTPAGGTIELEGDHNKAMEQANEQMAEHCGYSNFTVLFEGSEPVDVDRPPPTVTEPPRTTYLVRYQCDGGTSLGATPQPGL